MDTGVRQILRTRGWLAAISPASIMIEKEKVVLHFIGATDPSPACGDLLQASSLGGAFPRRFAHQARILSTIE